MSSYSEKVVRNLLTEYRTLREFLCEGTGEQSPITQFKRKGTFKTITEKPLGATYENPHPFQIKGHAQSKPKGKEKARAREELLIMLVEVDQGLSQMTCDERRDLIEYYVNETKTMEELCKERRQNSAAVGMHLKRLVTKLTEVMNNDRPRKSS